MKRPFNAGYAPSNRWTFDHRQAKKPSFWGEAIARPHLIVAAVGTLALVGLAGTAIWMVLPDGSAQVAVVKAKESTTDAASAAATGERSAMATAKAAPSEAVAPPRPAADAAATAPRLPQVEAATPSSNSVIAPMLDATNPRWVDPSAPAKPSVVEEARTAPPAAAKDIGDDVANAYADEEGDARDSAATSAIPNFQAAGKTDETAAGKQAKVESTPGRIARSVTMRSRPNVRGGVVTNVPAKSQVDVIACSQWCEIIYKGKRGFIYKSFMSKG